MTQNVPDVRSRANVRESRRGRNATSGGDSDTEVKVPITMPTGSPSSAIAVTSTTPVG